MSDHAPPSDRLWLPSPYLGAAAACTFCFGVLATIWWLGYWPVRPGLFEYRSASLGYGLLLPALVGLLLAGARALAPTGRDRSLAFIGAGLGLLLAAGITVLWLTDPDPQPNWSFPGPHDFNLGGIWNSISLGAGGAFIGAFLLVTVARARGARQCGSDLAEIPDWGLALFVGCAVSLAGLVALDNGRATETQAGLATTAALVTALAVSATILASALGATLKRRIAPLTWGTVGAAGLVALSWHGINGEPQLVATVLVSALLLGLAVSRPFSDEDPIWAAVPVAALAVSGGTGLALYFAPSDGATAFAIAGGTAVAVIATGTVGRRFERDVMLRFGAVLFAVGTLALTGWVATKDRSEATRAINALVPAFEILVLVLIRQRFVRLPAREDQIAAQELEEAGRQSELSDREIKQPGPGAWIEFVGFALPALLAVFVFLEAAAPKLGSDQAAGGATALPSSLLPAGLLGVLAGAGTAILARRRHRAQRCVREVDLPLPIPWGLAVAFSAAAGLVVLALLTSLSGDQRLIGLALLLAGLYGAICAEDLRASAARIHLYELGVCGWLVVAGATAVQSTTLYWLLSTGLWDNGAPASVGSTIGTTLAVLSIATSLYILGGLLLAWSMPGKGLTPESPAFNVVSVGAMYLVLALMGAVAPAFAVGRIEAAGHIADSGLYVLSSVFIIPSLVAAYAWVLGQNREHVARERKNPIRLAIRKLADENHECAQALNNRRLDRQREHVIRQQWATVTLLFVGIGYVAAVAI